MTLHVSQGVSFKGKLLQTTVKSTFGIAEIGWNHDHDLNQLITTSIIQFQAALSMRSPIPKRMILN